MAKLQSSVSNGEPDPGMAFGFDILGWYDPKEKPRKTLRTNIYIEAFGSRIVRPPKTGYLVTFDDAKILADWLDQYLGRTGDALRPFRTLEPVFELQLTPVSSTTSEVFARLLAYGTVPNYFDEGTGPALYFESRNEKIVEFRSNILEEIGRVLSRDDSGR